MEPWVEPSPKFQSQAVIGPLDLSVNWTVRGAVPEVGLAVKSAVTGWDAAWAVMVALLALVLPSLVLTVRMTVKVPWVWEVCVGCC